MLELQHSCEAFQKRKPKGLRLKLPQRSQGCWPFKTLEYFYLPVVSGSQQRTARMQHLSTCTHIPHPLHHRFAYA